MLKKHRYGLVGYPLAHSLSQYLHKWFFANIGMTGEYKTYPTKPAALKETIDALTGSGIHGFNVTIPHKEVIVSLLDALSEAARLTGAVNTVSIEADNLVGHNTDVSGFSRLVVSKKIVLIDKTALLLGAGGAAKSVVLALIKAGIKQIVVMNRSLARAEALCKRMEGVAASTTGLSPVNAIDRVLFSKCDVIINATPVGMWPNTNEVPLTFKSGMEEKLAIDLVYNPLHTKFLRQASLAGATVIDGLDMFIYQGAASLKIWLGMDKPLEYSHENLRAYLQEQLESFESPAFIGT